MDRGARDIAREFPLLNELCRPRADRLRQLALEDPTGFVLRQAEHLLEQLRHTRVSGVEKLATNGLDSAGKFENLMSELRFALLFDSVGAQVKLLADNAFAPAQYTPDLDVQLPNGLRVLVDVVHGTHGSPDLP